MTRQEKIILKPKWFKGDQYDVDTWDFIFQETIMPLLKEEMLGVRRDDVHYGYSCPYCDFKSSYFYCIDLHMLYDERCSRSCRISPSYPINNCFIIIGGEKIRFIP